MGISGRFFKLLQGKHTEPHKRISRSVGKHPLVWYDDKQSKMNLSAEQVPKHEAGFVIEDVKLAMTRTP